MVLNSSFYRDNPLNRFDTYTYWWGLHICHPRSTNSASAADIIENSQEYYTLAETGAENEITIDSVMQDAILTFERENRNAVANIFDITLIEPGGLTLFNRIVKAAGDLGIENHLQAVYILELRFKGWDENGNLDSLGPYYWTCIPEQLPMQYRDGASVYNLRLIEVQQQAYSRIDYHTRQDMSVTAGTYGEFLSLFEQELNDQSLAEVIRHPYQLYPTLYSIGTNSQWANWEFDAPANAQSSRGIQVSGGGGTLRFDIPQGSGITTIMAMALFHTRNFRRVYTRAGFALPTPENVLANPDSLAEFARWISFETGVEYLIYDPIIRHYQKRLSFNAIEYYSPELIHDPESYRQLIGSESRQRTRLQRYFSDGLLRKRYDYTYTGLNTDVLNLDINFNNAFFVIQPLNSSGPGFNGFGTDIEQSINRLKQNRSDRERALNDLLTQRSTVEFDLENDVGRLLEGGDASLANTLAGSLRDTLSSLSEQIRAAEEALSSVTEAVTEQYVDLLEEARTRDTSRTELRPVIDNRFISQTDFYGSEASDISETHPATFRYWQVNSLATNGPEEVGVDGDLGTNVGAAKLGAIEMNLNTLADLLEINIEIRGDPYWLGQSDGAPYDLGGNAFFLNVNFPTYPNESSGLMTNIGDFSLKAIYRATRVTSYYSNGQFNQVLNAFYDNNTNVSLIEEELMAGFVTDRATAVPTNLPDPGSNETNTSGSDETTNAGNPNPLAPGATGDSPPGGHSLASDVRPELNQVLTQVGNELGLRVVTTSGNRGPGGSGRHNSYASDVALFSGDRRLTVANPQDRALIQNFTQGFIDTTRSQGFLPGVGVADHTAPSSQWYMSGQAFHYDIAGSFIGESRSTYWGNGESRSGAPSWLRNIF